MNRGEAETYNELLRREVSCLASECTVEKALGEYVVDHCITIIPDDPRRGMIFWGKQAVSYKPGNIRIDLKNAIVMGLEFSASLSMPENLINY